MTPWTTTRQASLPITNSQSLPKLMSIESVMPSNHLILCCPLLLPPSIFPSIRVFSNEPELHIRWPKYWSFSFNISPSSEHSGLISFRMDWLDINSVYISQSPNYSTPPFPSPLGVPSLFSTSRVLHDHFELLSVSISMPNDSPHLAPNIRSLKLRLIESYVRVIGLPLWLSW